MLKLPTENTLDREEKIMVEWIDILLSDILMDKGYIRGPFGSALKRGDMKEDGIPVYEQQHAIYNSRDFRYYIDEQKFNEMKRFQVKKDDLIISCSGTVGKVSIIKDDDPKGIISQALLLLRADTNKVLPLYLKYFFSSREGYNAIVSRSSGSVQVNIAKRGVIEQIPLKLPQIKTQRKIVGVLSSIDEKIEENERINNNLEQQAVLLFKKWFIEFDNSSKNMLETRFGLVPESFKLLKNRELPLVVTDYVANGSFASLKANVTLYQEPNYAYFIRNTDLKSGKFEVFVDEHSYNFLSKSTLYGGEIIISNVGDVGSVFLCPKLDKPMTLGNNIIMLRPEQENLRYYLYIWFKWLYGQSLIQGIKGGSAQPKFNKTDFKNFPIFLPPDDLLEQFHQIVKPMFELIDENNMENQALTRTRDTILPRLMSGELDVSDIEI